MERSKSIRSLKDLWWGVRPNPTFGTLEVRICDGLPTVKETLACVALLQALFAWLDARYQDGDTLHVREVLETILKNTESLSARLGGADYLGPLEGLSSGRAPFERQRAAHRATSALAGVTDGLVQELRTNEPVHLD